MKKVIYVLGADVGMDALIAENRKLRKSFLDRLNILMAQLKTVEEEADAARLESWAILETKIREMKIMPAEYDFAKQRGDKTVLGFEEELGVIYCTIEEEGDFPKETSDLFKTFLEEVVKSMSNPSTGPDKVSH